MDVDTGNEKSESTRHLLSLPQEIRLLIYGYLFQERYLCIWTRPQAKDGDGDENTSLEKPSPQETQIADFNILRTCKLVYEEASDLFYRTSTIHFYLPCYTQKQEVISFPYAFSSQHSESTIDSPSDIPHGDEPQTSSQQASPLSSIYPPPLHRIRNIEISLRLTRVPPHANRHRPPASRSSARERAEESLFPLLERLSTFVSPTAFPNVQIQPLHHQPRTSLRLNLDMSCHPLYKPTSPLLTLISQLSDFKTVTLVFKACAPSLVMRRMLFLQTPQSRHRTQFHNRNPNRDETQEETGTMGWRDVATALGPRFVIMNEFFDEVVMKAIHGLELGLGEAKVVRDLAVNVQEEEPRRFETEDRTMNGREGETFGTSARGSPPKIVMFAKEVVFRPRG